MPALHLPGDDLGAVLVAVSDLQVQGGMLRMTEVFVDDERIDGIQSVRFDQTIDYYGFSIHPSRLVPEGTIIQVESGSIHVGLFTYFAITHSGLYPLESRYTIGAAEARRDRRLHGPR